MRQTSTQARLLAAFTVSLLLGVCSSASGQPEPQGPVAKAVVLESLGDIPITVTSIGDAKKPSILFIHGFMSSSVVWKQQFMSALNEEYFLSAVDVRGHGSSGKPVEPFHYTDTRYTAADIATAIDGLGLDKPILVAHSYGGLFALDYLRHYGDDDIAGLVFVGSNGGIAIPKPKQPDTPDKLARIERSRSPNIFTITEWTTSFVDDYLLGKIDTDTQDAEMLRAAAMMVPHYVRRHLRDHPTNNLDLAPALDLPVTFLAGENHGGANPQVLDFARRQVKDAKVSVIKDQAHMAHWRAPQQFNDALRDVLASML